MKEIPISVLRAKCCEILERVRKTRLPLLVTRYGRPFVEVLPPASRVVRKSAPREIMAAESRKLVPSR
jgi:prevent-host-death family protein